MPLMSHRPKLERYGRIAELPAPLERGGPPPLFGEFPRKPISKLRRCMGCWGGESGRGLRALQKNRVVRLEWRRLWSAVALHRF